MFIVIWIAFEIEMSRSTLLIMFRSRFFVACLLLAAQTPAGCHSENADGQDQAAAKDRTTLATITTSPSATTAATSQSSSGAPRDSEEDEQTSSTKGRATTTLPSVPSPAPSVVANPPERLRKDLKRLMSAIRDGRTSIRLTEATRPGSDFGTCRASDRQVSLRVACDWVDFEYDTVLREGVPLVSVSLNDRAREILRAAPKVKTSPFHSGDSEEGLKADERCIPSNMSHMEDLAKADGTYQTVTTYECGPLVTVEVRDGVVTRTTERTYG